MKETLGKRLAALRKERGLSQEGLGELVGVSRQAVSKWESDSTLPDVNNCIALSRALGVTLNDLLGLEEDTIPAAPLTPEQLELAETIAREYIQALPRRRSWRQRRKWPWVLAACVALVGLSIGAEWVLELNRTVSYMSSELGNVHTTVSQTVEEQVNAALEEVTRLVDSAQGQLAEVDLAAGTATFDLSVQLRRRTPDTPVTFTLYSGGETCAQAGQEEGGQRFSARLTCPLSDEITGYLTYEVEGETRTEEIFQELQLEQSVSMQLVHAVRYALPYTDRSLEGDRLPQGTAVPVEYQILVERQDLLPQPVEPVSRMGLFVNGVLAEVPQRGKTWTVRADGSFTWFHEADVALDGLTLREGDEIVLAVYAWDNYGRTLTQVLWRGWIGEDGSLTTLDWGEEEPYPTAEEADWP